MRVAFFHELPVSSGSRKAVNEIANTLKKSHIVDLYFIDAKRNPKEEKIFNTVYFYKFQPVKWNGKDWKARLKRDSLELLTLYTLHKKIASDIKKRSYDIVFVHGSKFTESPFILQFSKSNYVYYAHAPNYTFVFEAVLGIPKIDPFRFAYEKINRYIRWKIDLRNLKSIYTIFANSKYTQKSIWKRYKKKSTVRYLGVDTNVFKPIKIEKDFDVLFIGSYHPVDGYPLLDEAVKKIKPKPKLRVLAIENEWIQSDIELSKLYNQSKIVVCLAHKEPFGMVAIEAMACGVPVIAVGDAGYKESVIDNKTGYLIARDVDELQQKIEYLLTHEKKRLTFGENAYIQAQSSWDWEGQVQKMERDFIKIAKKS